MKIIAYKNYSFIPMKIIAYKNYSFKARKTIGIETGLKAIYIN